MSLCCHQRTRNCSFYIDQLETSHTILISIVSNQRIAAFPRKKITRQPNLDHQSNIATNLSIQLQGSRIKGKRRLPRRKPLQSIAIQRESYENNAAET